MSWISEVLDMGMILREIALQPVSESDLSLGSFPEVRCSVSIQFVMVKERNFTLQ